MVLNLSKMRTHPLSSLLKNKIYTIYGCIPYTEALAQPQRLANSALRPLTNFNNEDRNNLGPSTSIKTIGLCLTDHFGTYHYAEHSSYQGQTPAASFMIMGKT